MIGADNNLSASECASCDQLISERDEAQEAMSQAFLLVVGHNPEWSNNFGYTEALCEMTEVITQGIKDMEMMNERLSNRTSGLLSMHAKDIRRWQAQGLKR